MTPPYQQHFADRMLDTQLERHVTFRSGKTVDFEMSNSFIDMEEGRALLLTVFRDITVRKQAEEREHRMNAELARSQAELRKKNEIMEEDLKMAREIQLAMLPQQYPSFSAGRPAGRTACCISATAIILPARWAAISSTFCPCPAPRPGCLSAT